MRKNILCFLCLILLLLPFSVSADVTLVVDNADILSLEEESLLEVKAQELTDSYQMDVVILTIPSLNGEQSDLYAQAYYEDNLYGIGSSYDGILFLLSMQEREWAMITCGNANYVLTDYGIESIFSDISWYLADDMYYTAFDTWLDELVGYFEAYEEGKPIDGYIGNYDGPGYYEPIQGDEVIHYDETVTSAYYIRSFFISLILGLIVAGIALLILRGQMRTARAQRSAASYLLQGSYQLHLQRDIFLYSNISKVRKAENSSGGHGGGSTVRSGGGGRSFGGGRGKF